MSRPELAQLELLAEVDALIDSLSHWADAAPEWPAARRCQALVRRLVGRTDALRARLEAPLVIATLGGTGTGKSSLTNALVGEEVTLIGKARPTTRKPVMICRPDLSPGMLGIDPQSVELVERDLPSLADMVIIDCPDPDTSETQDSPDANLTRLRQILPHCDVLLVTTTQQKYRSARVADELAAAAPGARLVFVQTHADVDQDIREDWQHVLDEQYTTGHLFFVDSVSALADARNGQPPRGEFKRLVDLLTRELAGAAPVRIRRANFLDLAAETLDACRQRIDEGAEGVSRLKEAIVQQRTKLSAVLAERMRSDLLTNRRQWESRLLGKVAGRWGFSPFALVLRLSQALGSVFSGTLLLRARTPAQLALWGVMEGARNLHAYRRKRHADQAAERAVTNCWDATELRTAAIVLEGYASEAGIDRHTADVETVAAEAARAGQSFVDRAADELESLLGRVAQRHTGWFTRFRYEVLLLAVLGWILFRPAKNFFYDSWAATPPVPLLGLEFYLISAIWLTAWCGLLLWAFTSRLRGGLRREVDQLAQGWSGPHPAAGIFVKLESECQRVERFRQDLQKLQQHVANLRRHLAPPDEHLGHVRPIKPRPVVAR